METIGIIGGGPAGATAAERLASGGARIRVLVFEEKLGWEKPCGGGLTHKALRRYPFLLDATEPHTLIRDAEFVAANGDAVRLQLARPLAIYSRSVLNSLLLDRACEAGAEVIAERVLGFERRGDGWELQSRNGRYFCDRLILAAGARTALRRRLLPDFGPDDFIQTFGYYAPGGDGPVRVQFFENFEGYAWAFPRPDHLSIGIAGKIGASAMAGLKSRLHAFMRAFGYDSDAALKSLCEDSRRSGDVPIAGSGKSTGSAVRTPPLQRDGRVFTQTLRAPIFSHVLPTLSRASWKNLTLAGPGWALAGDAAGLVDPITGEGIYFAMRSGELLADSILEGVPERYPERVRRDFVRKLAFGARLSHRFYLGTFLGESSVTRMIEYARRSRAFRQLMQDLIDGSQTYPSLAARVCWTFVRSFGDLLRSSGDSMIGGPWSGSSPGTAKV
ncbi:MAG TPA: NAD(P)/FAD-dependent oxidoreductase [Terriglobia bacterium]|nr:NAD(P)/FAD-dependent oxidoreductase [Terriglobia bacterium]